MANVSQQKIPLFVSRSRDVQSRGRYEIQIYLFLSLAPSLYRRVFSGAPFGLSAQRYLTLSTILTNIVSNYFTNLCLFQLKLRYLHRHQFLYFTGTSHLTISSSQFLWTSIPYNCLSFSSSYNYLFVHTLLSVNKLVKFIYWFSSLSPADVHFYFRRDYHAVSPFFLTARTTWRLDHTYKCVTHLISVRDNSYCGAHINEVLLLQVDTDPEIPLFIAATLEATTQQYNQGKIILFIGLKLIPQF